MKGSNNPYFNVALRTPNGPGTGDQMIYVDGTIRIVVRHDVKKLTSRDGGVLLMPQRLVDDNLSCLYHYDKSEVKIEG